MSGLVVWPATAAIGGETTSVIASLASLVGPYLFTRKFYSGVANKSSGQWSKEEEIDLTKIVTEMTIAQGKTADLDVFWTQVARKMGNRRSRNQCRIKW